jgi:thiazole/oxazole-forming peptide maturase SagD family component
MRIFADRHSLFFLRTLDLFKRVLRFLLSYELDSSSYVKSIVKVCTGAQPFIENKLLDSALPQLYMARYGVWQDKVFIGGVSVHTDKKNSASKAQGEFLERYVSHMPEIVTGSIKKSDLGITAQSLIGSLPQTVSLEDIYWGIASHSTKYQVTTSGVAGHFDKAEAIVNAWLELIERDAFLVHWLTSLSPAHIDIKKAAHLNQELKSLVDQMEEKGIQYYFLDTTSDIPIPVCTCIVVMDSPTGKRVGVGAKAGFDGSTVLIGALTEALGVLGTILSVEPYRLPSDYKPLADVRMGKSERARLYTSEEGFLLLSPFLQSEEIIDADDFIGSVRHKEQLSYLTQMFEEKSKSNAEYEVHAYSFKSKLLYALDYKVVRVMCKALYPMYLQESFADSAHPRLKEFLKHTGRKTNFSINTAPHPFP